MVSSPHAPRCRADPDLISTTAVVDLSWHSPSSDARNAGDVRMGQHRRDVRPRLHDHAGVFVGEGAQDERLLKLLAAAVA